MSSKVAPALIFAAASDASASLAKTICCSLRFSGIVNRLSFSFS